MTDDQHHLQKAQESVRADQPEPSLRATVRQLELFAHKFLISGSGCWIWTGFIAANGYGRLGRGRKVFPAHRWGYLAIRGGFPLRLDLDHLCRNRACVNPYHLEPVTRSVNQRRGLVGMGLRKMPDLPTHCKLGHEYTLENTHYRANRRSSRVCITCDIPKRQRYYATRKLKARLTKGGN